MEKKHWYSSLTILSAIVAIVCFNLIGKPGEMDEGTTWDQFDQWAQEQNKANDKNEMLRLVGTGAGGSAIYGRKRAKKGIGKNDKKDEK